MANILYRQATLTVPTGTSIKGSLLTGIEVDGNFKSLNDDIETRLPKAGGTLTGSLNWAVLPTVASSPTTDIGASTNYLKVSGTASISSLGSSFSGVERTVLFTGIATLTHSASLVLPYAVDIVTAPNDIATFICVGTTNWVCVSYSRDVIPAGTTSQYYKGDKTWSDFFTSVRASTLTGLSLATSTAIIAADTVLVALGKLQAQISTKQDILVSAVNLKTVNGNSLLGSGNVQTSKVVANTPSNNTRLTANTQYFIDGTITSGFTFLLPAGTQGMEIEFVDMYGNWNTGPWYVGYDATGGKIMGLAENMLVNRANYNFTLVYTNATGGWRIK